jgi:hypothetical protein
LISADVFWHINNQSSLICSFLGGSNFARMATLSEYAENTTCLTRKRRRTIFGYAGICKRQARSTGTSNIRKRHPMLNGSSIIRKRLLTIIGVRKMT